MEEDIQIFTIPLNKAKGVPRSKRAKRAITEIKDYIKRHLKAAEEDIWIDHRLNEKVWSRGIQNPPSKIKVRTIEFEDGLIEVSLPEE